MLYMLAVIDSFSISDSISISLLGILVGFACLCALMLLVYLLRHIVGKIESGKVREAVDSTDVTQEFNNLPIHISNTSNLIPGKGSVGEVNLHDVDDKTAAMLMAIVADEMKVPLNELRFISIRELKS